jgi:hypothetical protein
MNCKYLVEDDSKMSKFLTVSAGRNMTFCLWADSKGLMIGDKRRDRSMPKSTK